MQKKFSIDIVGTEEEKVLTNPECIGRHLAERLKGRTVVELCSCLGISLIQIAKFGCKDAVGVDISPKLVEKANQNAKLYGVKNVHFIQGDVTKPELLQTLSGDAVIIDPHWSKTLTLKADFVNKISETTPPADLVFGLAKRLISQNIILRLPSEIDDSQLRALGECDIERVYVNGQYHMNHAYYGNLRQKPESSVHFEYEKPILSDERRKRKLDM